MVLKRSIKFLTKKESSIIFLLLAPIIVVLAVPAIILFILREIFRIIVPIRNQNAAKREDPDF